MRPHGDVEDIGIRKVGEAGYDPRGFFTLFDKMASEEAYVKSASFFRTHPPFFDRIVSTFSEIDYLPKAQDLQVDSNAFQQIKTLKPEVAAGGARYEERSGDGRLPVRARQVLSGANPLKGRLGYERAS